jgi:hypothetical protein
MYMMPCQASKILDAKFCLPALEVKSKFEINCPGLFICQYKLEFQLCYLGLSIHKYSLI